MEEAVALKMQAFVNCREPRGEVESFLESVPLRRILEIAGSGDVLAKRAARLVASTEFGARKIIREELVLSGLQSQVPEAASLLAIAFQHSSEKPSVGVLEALGKACDAAEVADAAAEALSKLPPESALIALGPPRRNVRVLDAAVRCASKSPEPFSEHLDELLELACSTDADPLDKLTALELLSSFASRRQGATFLLGSAHRLEKLMAAASFAEDPFHSGDRALGVLGSALGAASLTDWDASSKIGQDFLGLALNRFSEENEKVAAFHALASVVSPLHLQKVLDHPVSKSWLEFTRETYPIRTARLESIAKGFEDDSARALDELWKRLSPQQRAAISRDAASGHHEPLKLAAMRLMTNAISNTTNALADLAKIDGFYEWLVDENEPFESNAVDDAKLLLLQSAVDKTPSPFNDNTQKHLESLLSRRTKRTPTFVPRLAGEKIL